MRVAAATYKGVRKVAITMTPDDAADVLDALAFVNNMVSEPNPAAVRLATSLEAVLIQEDYL